MIGLPALSPTMEVGTIISWNKVIGFPIPFGLLLILLLIMFCCIRQKETSFAPERLLLR